jgi:hypothetical protein
MSAGTLPEAFIITYADRIFELIDVFAMLIKQSLPSLSTLVDICSAINRQASLHANLKGRREDASSTMTTKER